MTTHSIEKFLAVTITSLGLASASLHAANPIITNVCTADPAALVYQDKVYLYTGHDEARDNDHGYHMNNWLCFSSTNMVGWEPHGSPLAVTNFAWAYADAWASQVIERNGKFYWYVAVAAKGGKAVGVAVADSPTGPFKDARGSALVSNDMTKATKITWDDIDPTVWIDDYGQAYLIWGNTACYCSKLKENMIELDGPIQTIDVPNFTEAPWIHKHGNLYYLSYATGFPEKTAYATAPKLTGPWTYRGLLAEMAGNCNTMHQSIIDYKGKSYFIYHNGGIQPNGGNFRRSVCIDYLNYNRNGTIKRIIQTSEGVAWVN
jgi:beta-xylosidase